MPWARTGCSIVGWYLYKSKIPYNAITDAGNLDVAGCTSLGTKAPFIVKQDIPKDHMKLNFQASCTSFFPSLDRIYEYLKGICLRSSDFQSEEKGNLRLRALKLNDTTMRMIYGWPMDRDQVKTDFAWQFARVIFTTDFARFLEKRCNPNACL